MKIMKREDFFRGWFVGDFEQSIYRTKDFEVGVLFHKKGEDWPAHYHAQAHEINYLVKGSMTSNGIPLSEGDVFMFHPHEIANPEFLEDCIIVTIKTPSIPGDKFIVPSPSMNRTIL